MLPTRKFLEIQKQPPKLFLKNSQNSWENTHARVSLLIKLQVWALQLCLKNKLRHGCFSVNFVNFFCKQLFLKIWKLKYDTDRLNLSGKKLFWKCLENIQEHICIRLQVSLSCKFRKTNNWLNSHNDWNKVPQDLENKVTGLHFGRDYSVSIRIN